MANKLKEIILKNNAGAEVKLLNLGARISSIKIPVNDQLTEMTVGHKSSENYLNDSFYLGATCGPVCNRIAKAKFLLDGNEYQLSANNSENCLHGGEQNLSFVYWQVEQQSLTDSYAKFIYQSPDLEFGFPGNKTFVAEYLLDEMFGLDIHFSVDTDKNTYINLTNHVYFHLGENSCLPLQVQLNSDQFLERTRDGIPTGNLITTSELGCDIKSLQPIKPLIEDSDYQQIVDEKGVDHCFIINENNNEQAAAVLYNDQMGVSLKVFTNQLAVQMYTGAFLSEAFAPYQGVCLEAQDYVDAPSHSHFPSILVTPEKNYQKYIRYQFEVNC